MKILENLKTMKKIIFVKNNEFHYLDLKTLKASPNNLIDRL